MSSEPSLGNVPVSFRGGTRNAEDFRCFFNGQAAEKAKFDEAALLLVDPGEGLEGIVDSENLGAGELRHGDGGVELDLLTGAPLGGAASACVVNKNLAHEAGGDGDKVGAVFSVEGALAGEAQVGFMD